MSYDFFWGNHLLETVWVCICGTGAHFAYLTMDFLFSRKIIMRTKTSLIIRVNKQGTSQIETEGKQSSQLIGTYL